MENQAGFTTTPSTPARDTAAAATSHKQRLVADVNNRFTYHPPKDDQFVRYQQLRDQARELALAIVEQTPIGREQALSLTHLEQAVFFANAAIARNE